MWAASQDGELADSANLHAFVSNGVWLIKSEANSSHNGLATGGRQQCGWYHCLCGGCGFAGTEYIQSGDKVGSIN